MGSADNFRATDDLRTLLGFDIVARISDPAALERALHKYYDVEPESIGELINEIAGDEQLAALENRGESSRPGDHKRGCRFQSYPKIV